MSIRDTLAANRRALGAGIPASEEDVVAHLVMPVIVHLGYSASTARREYGIGRKRVDLALWPSADSTARYPPAVILEAKTLGTDFDKAASLATTPMRQIEGYLVSAESRRDVLGVLTDGDRWRVMRRTGSVNVETLGEWNIPKDRAAINKLRELVGRECAGVRSLAAASPAKADGRPKAVLDLLATDEVAPKALFGALALQGDVRRELSANGDAQARLAKAKGDWHRVAWTSGPKVEQDDVLSDASVVVGYAEVKSPRRDDVHVLLKALAARTQAGAAACLVAHRDGGGRTVRVAVHRAGRTGVGQSFDVEVPTDKAAEVVNRLLGVTTRNRIAEQRLEDVVSNIDVHAAFFKAIRKWVARKMAGMTRTERSALLRHLLRCVFVWSIRERIGIPDKAFRRLWWRRVAKRRSYHKHLVRFLFHDRLNKRRKRRAHPVREVQDALAPVRYLNGSLFAEQDGDKELALDDDDYFAHGESEGLWTIFAEHHWTTQEEDAEVREQSVDPKMLGGLFEHLMAAVETGSADKLLERMPRGTYYTPVDLVWEMTKDALTERLLATVPWKRRHVEALFVDGEIPKHGRERVARELASLTVFDPAVGSGEFLLGATKAIRRGLAKLGHSEKAGVRRVVEEQIHGQDVNALAASVARLRLFIAIEDDEAELPGERPLPNLEAKIVCADSIGIEIRKGTTPFSANDPDVRVAMLKCHELQDRFLASHGSRKAKVREARLKAGRELKAALRRTGDAMGSLEAFAEHDYLDHGNEKAVMTDPRWTFGAADGFDVVIGNPPYVGLRGMPGKVRRALRMNAERNGYGQFDDLFMPISEGALELAKPQGGTVCLVVPLSVSFARRKAPTRSAFNDMCVKIAVRHQDNRPDTVFGDSPVEHEENAQRTTIVVAVRGDGRCRLVTGGLGRWPKAHRHRYLRSRPSVPWNERAVARKLPAECRGQWPRIATPEGAEILREVVLCGAPMVWRGTAVIGLPRSARYFLAVAPAGLLDRGEETLACKERDVDSLLAVLNSGFAYLWWKAWGDGFHVKAATCAAMPDIRPLVPGTLLPKHGAALRDAMEHGERRVRQSGTGGGRLTENANLWEMAGGVLDLIDEALLNGLGLHGERYKMALAVERSRNITLAEGPNGA